LRAIDSKRLRKRLGELEEFYVVQVREGLRKILNI